MARWMVTGTGKGLGKALKEELEARGEAVIATTRQTLDQSKPVTFDNTHHIDVLILNAAEKDMGTTLTSDPEQVLSMLNTNAVGSLRVLQAALPFMGPGGKVVMITSQFGCTGQSGAITVHGNEGSMFIPATYSLGYRMSKSALHKLTQCAADDLKPQGIIVFAIDPGWIKTDMGGDFANMDPIASASDILDTIIATNILYTGQLMDWSGRQLKW